MYKWLDISNYIKFTINASFILIITLEFTSKGAMITTLLNNRKLF